MTACLTTMTTKTVIGSRFSYTSVWILKSKSGSAEIVPWLTSITMTVATYVCNLPCVVFYAMSFITSLFFAHRKPYSYMDSYQS